MIFQLSDWFPKPMIWAIIVKFDQIWENWWGFFRAEILEVGKNVFAASSVKKMSRFEEVSPEKIKRIAWKFTKTVILLGLAGYELIIETLRYPEIGVPVTGSTMLFHFTVTSSILPGRLSRFSGVDTSLPVEELRVREYKLQDGETSTFFRHLKYKCELFDSLAMLL